jgi:L-fuconolactonase
VPEPVPVETIIDVHLHLWRLADGWYSWNTPALGPVHSDASLGEVQPAMLANGVVGAVVVQAADHPAETDRLLALARVEPTILGVVGWLAVDDPDELHQQLRRWRSEPKLVGVRQLWHDHADPAQLASTNTLNGLEALGAAGLPVDLPDAFPRLSQAVEIVVESLPETLFVLDHCGKPPFGDADGWPRWEDWFVRLAAQSNVIIKLSGLFGGSGASSPASDSELRRVLDLAQVHAAADRIMIGTDWPMLRGRMTYAECVSRLRDLIDDWSPAKRMQVLHGTATRVYRLESMT